MNEQELIKKWEEEQEIELIWGEIWPLKSGSIQLLFPRESVVVRPLSPPSGIIHYIDFKYNANE